MIIKNFKFATVITNNFKFLTLNGIQNKNKCATLLSVVSEKTYQGGGEAAGGRSVCLAVRRRRTHALESLNAEWRFCGAVFFFLPTPLIKSAYKSLSLAAVAPAVCAFCLLPLQSLIKSNQSERPPLFPSIIFVLSCVILFLCACFLRPWVLSPKNMVAAWKRKVFASGKASVSADLQAE